MTRGVRNATNLEITDDPTMEVVQMTDFEKAIEDEAFMNELVTVLVAATVDENAPSHVVLGVNGTNQPIFRDIPTTIKRKYLEVLARCRETKYSQRTSNPMEPDRIENVPRTAFAYPFQVIEDKNPKGSAWLQAVMRSPA